MKKIFLFAVFALSAGMVYAQKGSSTIDVYYPVLRKAFEEKNAYKTTDFVQSRWRWPANKGYNESIFYVEDILKKAGYVKQVKGDDDGPLTYRVETRPAPVLTWDPISATVTIDGEQKSLETFATNFN